MRIYPQAASVFPGDAITFCVSVDNDGDFFHIDFYRQGTSLVWAGRLAGQIGQNIADGQADTDWAWPQYLFPIPAEWPTGAYVAVATAGSGEEEPPDPPAIVNQDIDDSRALFVVKSSQPGIDTCILFKIALNTYHAYNFTGGNSFYYSVDFDTVSMRRPGGGLGGLTTFTPDTGGCCGDDDVYDPETLRQTFGHWEAQFIEWLENAGIKVDYCTDVDIHCDGDASQPLLASYQLVLCVGHDEYWSQEMRDNLASFRDRGGRVAIFSANTCYRKVEFHDSMGNNTTSASQIVTMFRLGGPGSTGTWRSLGEPENGFTGVSLDNAGGWWSRSKQANGQFIDTCDPTLICDSTRDPLGFTVEQPGHWLFEGTGLQLGDVFGDQDHLVGYECDGAVFTRDVNGIPLVTGVDGTPSDFQILATAILRFSSVSNDPTSPGWQDTPPPGFGVATIVIQTVESGGIVLNLSTTDWSRVVLTNPTVDQITRNAIARLATTPVRLRLRRAPQVSGRYLPVTCPRGADCLPVRFEIEPASIPRVQGLHFEWTISAGSSESKDQPFFDVIMPDRVQPVTVSVRGGNGAGCSIFGTLTFTPLTPEQFLQAEIWSTLRNLALTGRAARRPIQGRGERGAPFVSDPLIDPIPNPSEAVMTVRDLERLQSGAEHLSRLLGRLNQRLKDRTESKG